MRFKVYFCCQKYHAHHLARILRAGASKLSPDDAWLAASCGLAKSPGDESETKLPTADSFGGGKMHLERKPQQYPPTGAFHPLLSDRPKTNEKKPSGDMRGGGQDEKNTSAL